MSTKDFIIENSVLISYKGSDESVEIPAEVEKIGAGAFKNNRKIKNVAFACKNLKSIEEDAFYDCTSLEGIKIPEGTVQIAKRAFMGCTNMEYIYIPSSVMIIGDIATESSVAVFGSAGSEAEKYAKSRLATFRTDFLNGLKLINNKKLEKENVTNRTFNVFGEEITVSSSLKRYHEILEYYNRRQEEFFDEMMTAVPKDYTSGKKVANGEPIFMGEREKTVKRLEKSGIYISEGELNSYTYDSMMLIGNLFKLIVKAYTELCNSALSDMKNQVQRFYDQAESQVTGLSYGHIGGGVGLVAYAFDDFLEKQKQRKRAYAVVEQQKTTYVNAQTAELNKTYAEFYNRFVPLYKKATDAHIEALLKCELDYYIKHGLIEADIKDKYDVVKSSELMQGLYEKNSLNAEYVVALALKLYPMNVSAHIYAIEKEFSCDDLEELQAFLKLESKLKPYKNNRYQKILNSVISCADTERSIRTLKSRKILSDSEIKSILTELSKKLTEKFEKLVEFNPPENINLKEYCEQKIAEIIDENSWGFFKCHEIIPIRLRGASVISAEDLITYLENAISSRQNQKEKVLKDAEFAFNKAETIDQFNNVIDSLSTIDDYKNAKELYQQAKEKKQVLANNIIDKINEETENAKTQEELLAIQKKLDELKLNRISTRNAELFILRRRKEISDEEFRKENALKQKEKQKKNIKIGLCVAAVATVIISIVIYIKIIIPYKNDNNNYNKAIELLEAGNNLEALTIFYELNGFKDSDEKIAQIYAEQRETDYKNAVQCFDNKEYKQAITKFKNLNDYKDSSKYVIESQIFLAEQYIENNDIREAFDLLKLSLSPETARKICSIVTESLAKILVSALNYGCSVEDVINLLESLKEYDPNCPDVTTHIELCELFDDYLNRADLIEDDLIEKYKDFEPAKQLCQMTPFKELISLRNCPGLYRSPLKIEDNDDYYWIYIQIEDDGYVWIDRRSVDTDVSHGIRGSILKYHYGGGESTRLSVDNKGEIKIHSDVSSDFTFVIEDNNVVVTGGEYRSDEIPTGKYTKLKITE